MVWDPRRCDMAQGHVAVPHEPMRTHAWRGHVAHDGHVVELCESTRTLAWHLRGEYSNQVGK